MRALNAVPTAVSMRWLVVLRRWSPMALQACGAALGLVTVVVVARSFGIEAQGRFGLLKGWVDAVSVLLMFGFPQALLHLSYHGNAPLAQLRSFAQRYFLRLVLASLPLAALVALGPWPWLAWVMLAAPGLVLHGLLRSLLLRAVGPFGYAGITIAPALTLFMAILVLAVWRAEAWGSALLASAAASALAATVFARCAGIGVENAPKPLALDAVNRQAFVQNACAAAQTPLLLSLVALLGASAAAVGETSVSLLFAQLFALAASFAAPVVYDAVARDTASLRAVADSRAKLGGLGAGLAALVLIAISVVPDLVPRLFPAAGTPTVLACQVMVGAGALLLLNRLGSTVLQARGGFRELTLQAVVRLTASLLLSALLIRFAGLDAALSAGLALLATEALLGARLWAVLEAGRASGDRR